MSEKTHIAGFGADEAFPMPRRGWKKVPGTKPTSQPCLDDEQLEKILTAAKAPHVATFFLLAETGLRIGEAIWLAWADVDFKSNVIRVRAKDDWKPKTGDEPAIPMSPKLRALLEARTRRGRVAQRRLPEILFPTDALIPFLAKIVETLGDHYLTLVAR